MTIKSKRSKIIIFYLKEKARCVLTAEKTCYCDRRTSAVCISPVWLTKQEGHLAWRRDVFILSNYSTISGKHLDCKFAAKVKNGRTERFLCELLKGFVSCLIEHAYNSLEKDKHFLEALASSSGFLFSFELLNDFVSWCN